MKKGKQKIHFIDNFTEINSDNNNNKITNISIDACYKSITSFIEKQKKISAIINDHINDENKFAEYYLINEKWFNKVSKIFEREELSSQNTNNVNIIHKKIKFNDDNLEDKMKRFNERKGVFSDESLMKVEFGHDKELDVKYPKNFIIIDKNDLNALYEDLKIIILMKRKIIFST